MYNKFLLNSTGQDALLCTRYIILVYKQILTCFGKNVRHGNPLKIQFFCMYVCISADSVRASAKENEE